MKVNQVRLQELIKLGDRLSEDVLYEVAVNEVESDQFDKVAQSKALEEAQGDHQKARAFYIKQRVRRIRGELDNELLKIKDLKDKKEAEIERNKIEVQKILDDEVQNNVNWSTFIILLFIFLLIMFASLM